MLGGQSKQAHPLLKPGPCHEHRLGHCLNSCVIYGGPMCWKQAPLWGVACLWMALSHVCSWPQTHFSFSGLREELLLPPFRSAPSSLPHRSLPPTPTVCLLLTKGGTGSSHLSFAKRRLEVLRNRSRRLWGTRNTPQTVQTNSTVCLDLPAQQIST